jgi:SUMO ligase MMS21 Smc5/6 complex component
MFMLSSINPRSLIHIQEVEKAFEHETSRRPEEFWLQDRNYKSLVDFSQASENEAAAEDDGEDIAVTSQAIQTIDPYTKKEFVDPVKNVVCNHAYERSTIMELLRAGRAPRCYHMGCNNKKVLASDLVPDDDLKRHMARLRARSDM